MCCGAESSVAGGRARRPGRARARTARTTARAASVRRVGRSSRTAGSRLLLNLSKLPELLNLSKLPEQHGTEGDRVVHAIDPKEPEDLAREPVFEVRPG